MTFAHQAGPMPNFWGGGRPRLLVVEDDDTIVEILEDILTDHYEVASAMEEEEVLDQIRSRRIDLLLLDYWLRDGNARLIARSANDAAIPVVWMTGDGEKAEALVEFSDSILLKPFTLDALLGAVAGALGQRH